MYDSVAASSSERQNRPVPENGHWKVMIVDDDAGVHQVTRMVMSGVCFEQQPVEFISAYSAAEACELLTEHPDTAVVLLDVVMEHDHAGLDVVQFLRNRLNNHRTRVVLRTGQPGLAPENSLIRQFDVDDYREKTELTKTKLVTLLYSALRAYRDITRGSAPSVTASGPSSDTSSVATAERGGSGKSVQPGGQDVSPLIATLSHELKTPLGVCVSGLTLLQEELSRLQKAVYCQTLSEQQLQQFLQQSGEAVELSLNNLQRSLGLVDDFRSVASGIPAVRRSDFALRPLVQQVIRNLQPELEQQQVTLQLECPDELRLYSDAGAFSQILINLINNSLKHAFDPAGRTGCITLNFECRQQWLNFSYRDNGRGIAQAVAPYVFDAFFTTGSDQAGNGMGLAIVKELTEQRLKGRVMLQPVTDQNAGCHFCFSLPLQLTD